MNGKNSSRLWWRIAANKIEEVQWAENLNAAIAAVQQIKMRVIGDDVRRIAFDCARDNQIV
jgi:hypothetical protein